MREFIYTIGFFLIIFFAIDKMLIFVRNSASDREPDKRMELLYSGKECFDVVIIGSSRGARDIMAEQIQDSFQLKTKNFSFPGSGIAFHNYVLSLITKNFIKKPRLVVLNIDDPDEFDTRGSRLLFRYDLIYPQVKYDQAMEKLIEDGQKNFWLSKIFISHQMTLSNLDFTSHQPKTINKVSTDGSMPIFYSDPDFDGRFVNDQSIHDSTEETKEGLRYFLEFVNTCDKNGIRLLLVFPPNFYKKTIGLEERIRELAGDKAYYFIHNDSIYPFSKEKKYYFDDVHLQHSGAVLFTEELIDFIHRNGIL